MLIANPMSYEALMDQELSITGKGLGGFKACLVLKRQPIQFKISLSVNHLFQTHTVTL